MKRTLLSLVMVLMTVCVSLAQVTTSSIAGKVTDAMGEVIGATVQAKHLPSGTNYGTITNAAGRYTISGMRPGGPYTVTISYVGSEPIVYENVYLTLGETASYNGDLKESATMLKDVVVTGQSAFDANKTGASMRINSADIARMPSISNSIADVTRMNPQLCVAQNGAMSFAGASNRYNSFMVDGAANNDVFGLTANGSNGGQAGTQPLSMETVDQIQVSVAPFDVRQSGFTGGAINAITKSGTNEFHGSVYGNWLNEKLIGEKYKKMDGTTSSAYDDETEYRYGATLGGPIIKDKLFFFANYEKSKKEYPNIYGLGKGGSKISDAAAQEVVDYISQLAEAQGVNYPVSMSNPDNYTESDKYGVKLDWNISDKHKASFRWSLVDAKQLNSNSSYTSMRASANQYDFSSKTNTFIAELQSRFNEHFSNELRGSYVAVRDSRDPKGIGPQIQVSNVDGGTMYFGTEYSSGANTLDQDIFTLTDNFTWYAGNHTLVFGTNNEFYHFENLFIQNIYGSYAFDSFDDLKNGVIKTYNYGVANEAITGNPRWAGALGACQLGFYMQDKIDVTDNFQLTFGLRADIPFTFDTPTENVDFNNFAKEKGLDIKTNQKLNSEPYWSPRIGFRWNVDGEKKQVLRGGVGVFTGRIPFVWLVNNVSNTGLQLNSYYASKPSNLDIILDPNGQQANADKLVASGSQIVNVFDKDFRFTQTARFNLGYDFTLAGIDWTAEALYSKTLSDVVYSDLTRDLTGKTVGETYSSLAFDQRPMLTKISNGTPLTNVYMLSNTSKGYAYNLSLKGEKKFACGLDVMASYTYSQSKSVNSGSSSVAKSNYNYNYTYKNPNDPELGNSAYNIPHQIKASVFYHKDYLKHWNTTVGLIYTASSGSPYSIYYYGDLNGDGSTGNDLFFIPTDEQLDMMEFTATSKYTAEEQRENMRHWIENDDYLSSHRGEYYERFADNEDFEHHFDFHFAQTFKFKVGKQYHAIELTADILNIGNLFNEEWGRYGSGAGSNKYYSPVTYKGNGKFQFLNGDNYQMRSYSDYYSRWRGQIGLKYTF